jgi:hypothetical protein
MHQYRDDDRKAGGSPQNDRELGALSRCWCGSQGCGQRTTTAASDPLPQVRGRCQIANLGPGTPQAGRSPATNARSATNTSATSRLIDGFLPTALVANVVRRRRKVADDRRGRTAVDLRVDGDRHVRQRHVLEVSDNAAATGLRPWRVPQCLVTPGRPTATAGQPRLARLARYERDQADRPSFAARRFPDWCSSDRRCSDRAASAALSPCGDLRQECRRTYPASFAQAARPASATRCRRTAEKTSARASRPSCPRVESPPA